LLVASADDVGEGDVAGRVNCRALSDHDPWRQKNKAYCCARHASSRLECKF
jgi:hypothetical protein